LKPLLPCRSLFDRFPPVPFFPPLAIMSSRAAAELATKVAQQAPKAEGVMQR
jgi:hypothetical protein